MKKTGFFLLLSIFALLSKAQANQSVCLKAIQASVQTAVNFSLIGVNYLNGAICDQAYPDTLAAKSEPSPAESLAVDNPKGINDLLKIAKKGKSVFVIAEDKGVYAHATKNIGYWNYWKICDSKEKADFILEIKFRYGNMGKSFAYALFIDVNTGKEIFSTRETNNFGVADFNWKRAAVNNLLDNIVKPHFDLNDE